MLSEFCKKIIQGDLVKNIAIILAVYAMQVVVFKDIFRCPCENHKAYGLLFLFTPAILLLALSLLACQRSRFAVTTMFLKHRNYKARCNYFLSSLVDFFRPFLALASWIVVVLLRGECYVCIRAGPGEKCLPAGEEINSDDFDHYYSQSFILGSGCLLSMVIFSAGILFIQQCCTNSYERLPTHDDLVEAKKNAIVEAFDRKTTELANEYAQKFVDSSFGGRDESEIDVDERFIQAREKVRTVGGNKLVSSCMIDIPFASMEITSSSNT